MNKLKFYVRLLTYKEALKVIDKMIEIGGYGNIISGGISLEGSEDNFIQIKEYLDKNCVSYKLSNKHPKEIEKEIIKNLK